MPEIEVEGLGIVEIEGAAPNPAELAAIQNMLQPEAPAEPTPIPAEAAPEEVPEEVPKVEKVSEEGTSFSEEFMAGLKERMTAGMAASLVGGEIGVKRGPAGLVVGGALGFAAGGLANDLVQEAMGDKPIASWEEASLQAFDDFLTDAQFGAAGVAVGPFLTRIKPAIGKVVGVGGEAATRITDIAARRGIDLGAVNVTKSRLIKGASKVLGVFPFIGTPFSKAKHRISGQLNTAMADMLNTLAPTSTVFDVGKEFTAGAIRRYAAFNRLAAAKYARFNNAAAELKVQEIVSTKPITDFIETSSKKQAVEAIRLIDGDMLKSPGPDLVGGFLTELERLPEKITVQQARGLERQLNEILTQAGIGGFDVSRLAGVKGALQKAKGSLDLKGVPKEQADEVIRLWDDANLFFHEKMKIFETPVAKKFIRVEKKIFKPGVEQPGFKNPDELMKDVVSARSVGALQDLKKLVGGRRFRRGARKFLEDAFSTSVKKAPKGSSLPDIFDVEKFSKKLNLNTPEGKAILDEMLASTSVSRKTFEEFIEVAGRASDVVISDPSGFLTRRLVLGGGLTGAVFAGAATINLPAAGLLTLVARKSAKFLSSPTALRDMTRVLDDTTTNQKKRVALLRVLRLVGEEKPKKKKKEIQKMKPL